MPTLLHSALTGADATHQWAYKQSTDPGTVGAGKGWIDTSAGPPYQLKVRNAGNTAWDSVSLPSSGIVGQIVSLTSAAPFLAAPAAPSLTTASGGGTLAAGTYQVEITYVNAQGETLASGVSSITTTGSTSTMTIASPPASGINSQVATGWYAYVTLVNGGTFKLQQVAGSPTAIGTSFTLTSSPIGIGAGPPVSNTAGTATATWSTPVGVINQSANQLYAGPASGAAAVPTFRALVNADLPSAPTVSGEVTGSDFKPTGLTGATAASRYVGATASGAPTTGTFVIGDHVIDRTGKLWICTVAGTPGTWAASAGASVGSTLYLTHICI